ncbi:hypothetical protein GXW82_42740 [Streptacidiphilus sp. 4-A2]|nr:hypothetical protein [Streptacidiphilus sp. 4-A2]
MTDRILLRAVTPQPMSLSTQLIGVGPSQQTVSALQAQAAKAKVLAEAREKAKARYRKTHGHDDRSIEADAR